MHMGPFILAFGCVEPCTWVSLLSQDTVSAPKDQGNRLWWLAHADAREAFVTTEIISPSNLPRSALSVMAAQLSGDF
jgi:hypothetical protein